MKENEPRKIAFPRYAEYNCAIKYILEQGLGAKCIVPPKLTRRTLELGARYSPDYACTPFKTLLGSMIECLEAGADTLMMVYGLCKLGYYGELEEQILRDLGYEFDFLNLAVYDTGKKRDFLKAAKFVNPRFSIRKLALAAMDAFRMAEYLDEVTGELYQNCGFQVRPGGYEAAYQTFLNALYAADTKAEIEVAHQAVKRAFLEIPIEKPVRPLRVGIVGEFYTAMDEFSNLEVEKKLSGMGVEIHRWMTVTNRMIHYPGEKNLNVKIRDLSQYEMGPTSTANIWAARQYAERGFDGLMHIKSANCTPEIDVMPALQAIAQQNRIPILFLTFDSQSSDTGLMTRLEAFYDMIQMRRKVIQ